MGNWKIENASETRISTCQEGPWRKLCDFTVSDG